MNAFQNNFDVGSSPYGSAWYNNPQFRSAMNNPATQSQLMSAANSMQEQFVAMVDERIRAAFNAYFSSETMPENVERAIKMIVHKEGIEHLGKAKRAMKSDLAGERMDEKVEGAAMAASSAHEEECDWSEEDKKMAKLYCKLNKLREALSSHSPHEKFTKICEMFPSLSNKTLAQLATFLNMPDFAKLAESEGVSIESIIEKM